MLRARSATKARLQWIMLAIILPFSKYALSSCEGKGASACRAGHFGLEETT